MKTNIVDSKYCIDDICKLRAVDFDWNRDDNKNHDIGFIAQEVQPHFPELVKESIGLNGNPSYLSVDYSKLVPILVESIKTLKEEIKDLKNERL